MKKAFVVIVLACAMVLAFASVAMADHSPQFYFNYVTGSGPATGTAFWAVFPTSAGLDVTFQNGSYDAGGPHLGYAQSTAKCGVCHSVHRAPTRGTGAPTGSTQSSRYALTAYASVGTPDTQLLLKSTAAGACIYCHVASGYNLMYGGWADLRWVSSSAPGSTAFDQAADATWNAEKSWNEFYGHTTGCTGCHAVHGAYTLPESKILKYQGVKASGTFNLVVQPEVYTSSPLYNNQADMIAGTLTAGAIADGVTLAEAAVTANCSICHANYSPDNNKMINASLTNLQLFQGASWAYPNAAYPYAQTGTDKNTPGTAPKAIPAPAWAPGVSAGGWRVENPATPNRWNTYSMMYKNHPMKNADALFTSDGATGNATDGSVSNADSYVCQSCHDAPAWTLVPRVGGGAPSARGSYAIQSFPHYNPGYYKFMTAQTQASFSTPDTLAEVDMGRIPFYEADPLHKPAIMNDGYCIKCHDTVGVSW